MALEGTLRDFSLADIFQLIGIQKKTGVLTLSYEGDEVTVSFLNGCVVSADSRKKNLEDRLGTVLAKSGKISEQQLQAALKIQRETMQRLGYILLSSRMITEDDLRGALRLQITQIVYRLFRWKDGEYHFNQEETVEYDRAHFTPLSAESILMEGIRMIDEWPIIERKIPSFDIVFRRTRPGMVPVIVSEDETVEEDLDSALAGDMKDAPGPSADGLRLTREAATVYDQVDGKRTVQEIIDRAHMGDFETCRILYDSLCRNLITTVDHGAVPRPVQKSLKTGAVLEIAAYLILAAGIAVSVATMNNSPLSGAPSLLAPGASIDLIDDLIARNRVERLDEAVQVYYLQKAFYPDNLRDLVKGHLVLESTIQDPWARGFGYLSSPEGYRIIAYDEGGVENPGRSVARGRVAPHSPPADQPVAQPAELATK